MVRNKRQLIYFAFAHFGFVGDGCSASDLSCIFLRISHARRWFLCKIVVITIEQLEYAHCTPNYCYYWLSISLYACAVSGSWCWWLQWDFLRHPLVDRIRYEIEDSSEFVPVHRDSCSWCIGILRICESRVLTQINESANENYTLSGMMALLMFIFV